MTIIQNTVTDGRGDPRRNLNVTITLTTGSLASPGLVNGGTGIGAPLTVTTDSGGRWSADLAPNSSISRC